MRAHEFDSILCTQLNKILPAYGWHTGEHIGSGNEAVDVSGQLPDRRVHIEVELRRDEPLTNVTKLWRRLEEEGHTNEVILVHAFSKKYSSPRNTHRVNSEFIGKQMERYCGVTYVPLSFPYLPPKHAKVLDLEGGCAAISLASVIQNALENLNVAEQPPA